MFGGLEGTIAKRSGTGRGWRGMNDAQRQIATVFVAGFLSVVALIVVVNAQSTISDLAALGLRVPAHLIWSWEWSSLIGWLTLYPFLWWTIAQFKPPKSSWLLAITLLLAGSAIASGWHIIVMVAIRHLYYAATGHGPYKFFDGIEGRILYEFRKDLTTYVQFVTIAVVVQWLMGRAIEYPACKAPRVLMIQDGAVRHAVPLDEIDAIRAAGNYIEVFWRQRSLLHRATLTATEADLGDAFVRIHRAQLVRRGAIRRISSDKSGDFTVTLQNGANIRGSRRYRSNIV